MKIFHLIVSGTLFTSSSLHASPAPNELSIIHKEEDVLSRICMSFSDLSEDEQYIMAQSTLNMEVNWEKLIKIEECRNLIKDEFDLFFHDNVTLFKLVTIGKAFWDAVTDAGLAKPLAIKVNDKISTLEFEPSDILIDFLFHFLQYSYNRVLPKVLTYIEPCKRKLYLEETGVRFCNGLFTQTASFRHYLKFFLHAILYGIITVNTYTNLMKSILNELCTAPPLKFNYLLKRLDFFYNLIVPQEVVHEYRRVMLVSGLGGREKLKDWPIGKFDFRSDNSIEIIPLDLELSLPKIIIDWNIAQYVTFVSLNGPILGRIHENIQISDDYMSFSHLKISKRVLELSNQGLILEAHEYLESFANDITDDIIPNLQQLLTSFIPDKYSPEEKIRLESQRYLDEFDELLALGADWGSIEFWSFNKDMSKRLKVWFQHEKCHPFLKKYCYNLVFNRKTIVSLIEMGEPMWIFLEKFSLLPIIKEGLAYYASKEKEPMLEIESDPFIYFYMHFLDKFKVNLAKSLQESRMEMKLECMQTLANNMRDGNFSPIASLGGHLKFFTCAFYRGLINPDSFSNFLKNLMWTLESGPALISNYIVHDLRGQQFEMVLSMENKFDWKSTGLHSILGTNLPKLNRSPLNILAAYLLAYNEDIFLPAEIDLKLPRIFHDQKFSRMVANFVLNEKFVDPHTDQQQSGNLQLLSIYIITKKFLDLANTSIIESQPCQEAAEFLWSTLSTFLDDDLSNRLFEVLWHLMPTNLRPSHFDPRISSDAIHAYQEDCVRLLDVDMLEIADWASNKDWDLDWNIFIGITQGREFISKKASFIFLHSQEQFIRLTERDDTVWDSFKELEILGDVHNKFFVLLNTLPLYTPNNVILRNFIRTYYLISFFVKFVFSLDLYKSILPAFLLRIPAVDRHKQLKKIATDFRAGRFTITSRMQDYIIFFYHAVEQGLVSLQSYTFLINSLIQSIVYSSELKRRYLLSQLFLNTQAENIPIPNTIDLGELSHFIDLDNIKRSKVNVKKVKSDVEALNLDIHLASVLFDQNIPLYIAHAVMSQRPNNAPLFSNNLLLHRNRRDIKSFATLPELTDPLGHNIRVFAQYFLSARQIFMDLNFRSAWHSFYPDLLVDDGYFLDLEYFLFSFHH